MKFQQKLFIFGFGIVTSMYASNNIPTTNSNDAITTSSTESQEPHYQQFYPNPERFFSPEAPGYNVVDENPKFNGVKPIVFKPENLSTGPLTESDQDSNQIGYFWNIKDSDPSLIYPGKARIGNEQYIDVVAVDPLRVDKTAESDDIDFTDRENIYNQNAQNKQQFQNDFLVKIGSFVHNGKLYDLYGRYMATAIPDPETTEYV